MNVSILDEIFGTDLRRSKGCRICGERTAVEFVIALRELGPDGKKDGRSKTVTRRFCAKHGVELFNRHVSDLEAQL